MQANATTQDTTIVIKRKSVALTGAEHRGLKKYIKGFNTLTEAAESIGVSRQVLDRVQLVGSGSPDNITLIREKIGTAA